MASAGTNTTGLWWVVATVAAVSVAGLAAAGLRLTWGDAALLVAICSGCVALSRFYTVQRPDPRLAAPLTAIAQMLVLSAAAGSLSYAAAVCGRPLADGTLTSWDRSLGFDWVAYLNVVDDRPWLARLYGVAYASFQVQIALVPIVLGFSNRLEALRRFVLAYTLAALSVVLVLALVPAPEAYVHFGIRADQLRNIPETGAYHRAAVLAALRDGSLKVFALSDIEGIITFPSFHTAVGVIVAASLWRVPLLRWPMVALDGLMIASTPIYGGHYAVDVVAGGVVAILALSASRAVEDRRARGTVHSLRGAGDEVVAEA